MDATHINDFCAGKTVLVRTYSAGVWAGKLAQKAGNEVILEGARRLWRFQCKKGISLSTVAVDGIDQSKSRLAVAVPTVWLEAIEIIPLSEAAIETVMGAPDAKAI